MKLANLCLCNRRLGDHFNPAMYTQWPPKKFWGFQDILCEKIVVFQVIFKCMIFGKMYMIGHFYLMFSAFQCFSGELKKIRVFQGRFSEASLNFRVFSEFLCSVAAKYTIYISYGCPNRAFVCLGHSDR